MQIDHVHFYVEDAKVWRDWFVRHLGFQIVVDDALDPLFNSGWGDGTTTEVVKNGSVYFFLSSPLLPTSPVAEFLRQHPPGVADIAFGVEDVEAAYALAVAHDAKVIQPIQHHQQGTVYVKWAKIAGWGSLTHTLVEKRDGGAGEEHASPTSPAFFTAIDHIVLNVATGDLERAVAWYENVLGFFRQQMFKIQTERSALFSRVLVSSNLQVQFPINEPASANSQIQEFLDINNGPGIQHIALRTHNIVNAIAQFRSSGLSFLPVPTRYYSDLVQRPRLPLSARELEAIASLEILVDWNEDADAKIHMPLLLQIFTQPIFNGPTFFFEFIERRSQARGFGEGNFRALFEAIEREQIKRGSMQEF